MRAGARLDMEQMTRWLGSASLYVFALFAQLGTAVAFVALAFMVLALLLEGRGVWARLIDRPLSWVFAAFIVYVLALALTPDTAGPVAGLPHWGHLWDWFSLWLFLVVAWWLGGDLRRIFWVLGLALVGFLLGLARHMDWSLLGDYLNGTRGGFGRTTLTVAWLAATALIGWVMFAPRICAHDRAIPMAMRTTLWLAVLVVLLEILFITQSRGIWLAIVALLPALAWLRARTLTSAGVQRRPAYLGVIALSIAVTVCLVVVNWETLATRLSSELGTIEAIAAGQFEDLPPGAISDRFYMYQLGWEQWLRRPIFGWGPGVNTIRDLGGEEYAFLGRYRHLHSAYLEILVQLGLIGVALFAAGVAGVANCVRQGYAQGRIPTDLMLFLTGAGALTAIFCLFDFRLTHVDFRFPAIVLLGVAYSFELAPEVASRLRGRIAP